MKYAAFWGCLVPTRAPGTESSMRHLADTFGFEFVNLPFVCCPSQAGVRIIDRDSWLAIAARNIALAEEAGLRGIMRPFKPPSSANGLP